MEEELIFHILGIESTKDEELIAAAYRNKLKNTNPEDNPEGFKRLRQAYEEALALARRREPEEEETEKTAVGLWIDKVKELYEDMEQRYKVKKWERLLADPVCEELDTDDEARDAMLAFLMDHIHLPHDVWKLIDKRFELVSGCGLLKEKFPKNFLNYVVYYVKNEGFIPFELFEVRNPSEENGDGYIDHYFSLKKQMDQKSLEGCEQSLEDLKAFGLYHPYEDVERIRLLQFREQKEAAKETAGELLEKYPGDCYIKTYAAYAFWYGNEKERANGLWKEVLEKRPNYYQAKMGVIRCLMENRDNYEAKEMIMEVLEANGRDEDAAELLKTANTRLIEEFEDKIRRGETDERLPGKELELEIGWCMFQNEQIDEAVRRFKDFVPGPLEEYSYCNLYGRILYRAGEYEKALPYLEHWLKLIEETTDDGSVENQKRISRKGRACYLLGGCYFEQKRFEEAEPMVRRAVDLAESDGEKLGCMQYLARILYQSGKYEYSVDTCDEMLKISDNYFPAIVIRQESCYELKKGQEVVDDYHRALAVFPAYYKPYLLAAKVFFHYSQYEDAKNVLDRAKENGAEFSDSMKLYQVKILRNLAQTDEERKQPLEILSGLKNGLKEETDIEDASELEFETALLYWEGNELKEALAHLDNAISQNRTRLQYYMVKGHICLDLKLYDEAISAYGKAEPDYGELAAVHYNKGLCYEEKGLKKLAIECFEKTLELEETYRDACEKLADYYETEYKRRYRRADFDKAISFMDRQIKVTENCYYLVHRGLIYMNALELFPAEKDFLKALEYSPEDWAAHNNLGCCYKYSGQFEKAIEAFKKSVQCMKAQKSMLPYSNMADCYEALRQYREAIHCYEEDLKLFPDYLAFWKEIGQLYGYLGDYKNAEMAFEKIKDDDNYYSSMGDLWRRRGCFRKAVWFYKKGVRDASKEKKAERLFDLGLLYMDIRPFMAPACLKKAVCAGNSQKKLFCYEKWLAICYYLIKKYRLAKQHGEKALCHFKNMDQGTEEDYIGYKPFASLHFLSFAWLWICVGDKKKGEEYFEQMDKGLRCKGCRYKGCHEKYYHRGMYREAEGQLDLALKDYEWAKELRPVALDVDLVYKKLRKKMKIQNDDRN